MAGQIADGPGEGTVLREWTWFIYTYSIVDCPEGRYLEARARLYGSEVRIRHEWWKWRLSVMAGVVVLVTMTAAFLLVSAMIFTMGTPSLVILVIMWSLYLVIFSMVYSLASNTFRRT